MSTYCADCHANGLREIQRESPSGAICKFGHGGAPGISIEKVETGTGTEEAETGTDDEFTAREGDVLSVNYAGVKLQIAPFSTVELDSAIYTRRLKPGEDPEVEFAKIHAFLAKQCQTRAREKLATFAGELSKAKRRAQGEG